MEADEIESVAEVEQENTRLKRILAERDSESRRVDGECQTRVSDVTTRAFTCAGPFVRCRHTTA